MRNKISRSIFMFCSLFFMQQIIAQQNITVLDSTADGTIRFANINNPIKAKTSDVSKSFLRKVLKTGKHTDFYLYRTTQDEWGMTHERYQQTYKGTDVEFSEFIVHKNSAGEIVSINGDFAKVSDEFENTTDISFDQAVNRFLLTKSNLKYNFLPLHRNENAKKKTLEDLEKYEKVIVKDNNKRLVLAYKVILADEVTGDHYIAYIDIKTGQIASKQPLKSKVNATGTAQTLYSGTRSITTDFVSGKYRLYEASRKGTSTNIHILNRSVVNDKTIFDSIEIWDNDNNWTSSEHGANRVALDALWAAQTVFDYFYLKHGRKSHDNNNGLMKIEVRVLGTHNASWSDYFKTMYLGEGSTSYGPAVNLDIIAHEFAHGICYAEITKGGKGLNYSKESGALSESLSDIWGACVEHYSASGKQTWVIGEDASAGKGYRSLQNPKQFWDPNTYQGQYWGNVSDTYDNGWIHTNSGVGNYWFYLLSEGGSGTNDLGNSYSVTGIGIEKAAKVVYNLYNYLEYGSDYRLARTGSINSAISIYGDGSAEVEAVTNAWYAVGVGSAYPIKGNSVLYPGSSSKYELTNGQPATWSCSSIWGISINPSTGVLTNNNPGYKGKITITAKYSGLTTSKTIEIKGNYIQGYFNFGSGNQYFNSWFPSYPVYGIGFNWNSSQPVQIYITEPLSGTFKWTIQSQGGSFNFYPNGNSANAYTYNGSWGRVLLEVVTSNGTLQQLFCINTGLPATQLSVTQTRDILSISDKVETNSEPIPFTLSASSSEPVLLKSFASDMYTYEIYNIMRASKVASASFIIIKGEQKDVDISTLAKGYYVLNVYKNNQIIYSEKFNKE